VHPGRPRQANRWPSRNVVTAPTSLIDEPLKGPERSRENRLRPRAGIDHPNASGIGSRQFAVGAVGSAEEVIRFALEPVKSFEPSTRARPGDRRVELKQQRPIWIETPGREPVDRSHLVDAEIAAGALVGKRGVHEPVEQHPRTRVEQWLERLLDELGPGRGVEERLGARANSDVGVLHQLAHALRGVDTPRLAEQVDVESALLEGIAERGRERGLSRSVDTLDRDQPPTQGTRR